MASHTAPGPGRRTKRGLPVLVVLAHNQKGIRQVAAKPFATLPEGLVLGEHGLDFAQEVTRYETMPDGQIELGDNGQLGLHQGVERVEDGALGRVLDRHDAEMRVAGLDVAKDIVDRGMR